MKIFFDFLPGLVFLTALYLYDIYVATAAVMAAMVIQVVALLCLKKRVGGIQWFILGVVLIFGSATLLLHNPLFIKWKPTVISWLFSLILISSPMILKKNFIKDLLKEQLTLPDQVWTKLNAVWAVLFAILGAINLIVAFNFSEKVWGWYKVFGITGLTFLFIIAQSLYLSRYLPKEPQVGDSK